MKFSLVHIRLLAERGLQTLCGLHEIIPDFFFLIWFLRHVIRNGSTIKIKLKRKEQRYGQIVKDQYNGHPIDGLQSLLSAQAPQTLRLYDWGT